MSMDKQLNMSGRKREGSMTGILVVRCIQIHGSVTNMVTEVLYCYICGGGKKRDKCSRGRRDPRLSLRILGAKKSPNHEEAIFGYSGCAQDLPMKISIQQFCGIIIGRQSAVRGNQGTNPHAFDQVKLHGMFGEHTASVYCIPWRMTPGCVLVVGKKRGLVIGGNAHHVRFRGLMTTGAGCRPTHTLVRCVSEIGRGCRISLQFPG